MDVRALLAAERRDLVALLRDLSVDEWDAPSLCAGWRVREVAGHLLYDCIPGSTYAGIVVRHGFGVNRVNNDLAARGGAMPTSRIVEKLEAEAGTLSRWVPRIVFADLLVHHQDIRRPLGRARTIPEERLRLALDHPDPLSFPGRRSKGLSFVATDLDWSRGSGPEVRGTGESLALAIGGRPVVLDELAGDGVPVLRRRLAGQLG
ncbi:maleylpyruvate isomerase family mycothiol-dependent enzyme [Nocardioides carbamazepini]|uniref:maleylpyruvate isomerase family mycothiol-dependent enzyme n=1 Tax=Nocardioides carbamazepini TaxID=2854259 RepID=UPI00214A5D0C|nr:maleylpyruvate isomerase family mycothiol-dependent enzyme [Nocardioides carbamazepini]